MGRKSSPSSKLGLLERYLTRYPSAIVAYSGGVDSSLLAYMCGKIIPHTLCVIEDAPSLPRKELKDAKAFCKKNNLKLKMIKGGSGSDRRYLRNARDRCYWCKRGLFKRLEKLRRDLKYYIVFDGANTDDSGDYRPGSRAATELGVVSPLKECGISKKDVRAISKLLGLPTWNKPQGACLSSRVPYGTLITPALLSRIERAEEIVTALGYSDVRARAHGDILRLEIGGSQRPSLDRLRTVVNRLKVQGFKYIVLDIEGYRTGSMNE